jgi:hypothetical protein
MKRGLRRLCALGAAALIALPALRVAAAPPAIDAAELAQRYAAEVDRRLDVPADDQRLYAQRLDAAFAEAGVVPVGPQAVVLVDRSVNVQALLLFRIDPGQAAAFIGASPVSTGSAGRFDHFLTPLGVFEHSLSNPDFRAEGTFNENGIRGYGERGLRVFDFGWVVSDRTWGARGRSPMRLQMHATDPDKLEQRLGRADSKGCIRIPASLNRFIDRYGILDADYDQAVARDEHPWVLRPDRMPVADPGRYLVVVDSATSERPDWARPPGPLKATRTAHAAVAPDRVC